MVRMLGFSIRNRTEAEEYAQKLLDNNWFVPINEKKFKDSSKALYRYSVKKIIFRPIDSIFVIYFFLKKKKKKTGKSLPPSPVANVQLTDFEDLDLILGKGGFAKVMIIPFVK